MNNPLHYIIESSIILAIFLLLFNLLLRKEKSFQYNRYFLLVAPLLALILPLLNLPFLPGMDSNESLSFVYDLPILVSGVTTFIEPEIQQRSISPWIMTIYIGGILIYIVRYAIQLFEIYSIIKTAKSKIMVGDITLIISNKPLPTFSFMRYIVIGCDKSIDEASFAHALEHERVHIRQKHSFDVLFIELISIFLWFNPVIHYFKISIRENHEFLADQYAAGNRPLDYSLALLKELQKGANNRIPSYFSMNLTRRRLKMIASGKSLSSALKPVVSLPFILLIFIGFSCKNDLLEKNIPMIDRVEADFYSNTPGDFEKIMKDLEIRYPQKLFFFRIIKDIDLEIVKANSNGHTVEYYHQLVESKNPSFEYRGVKIRYPYVKDGIGMIYSWQRNKYIFDRPYIFNERIYKKREVSFAPQPWLGELHLSNRLINHTSYPDISSDQISGTVWVKFTVNQMGNNIYLNPVRHSLNTHDQQIIDLFYGKALRAIWSLDGYYKPGIIGDNQVNVEMELPVHFRRK